MPEYFKVIVGYNANVSESRELAHLYLAALGVPSSRAVQLDCSTDSILGSYEEFRNTVEVPLRNAGREGVSAFVLGFRVPVAFIHNGGYISSCSRLSSPYPFKPGKINEAFHASGNYRASKLYELNIIPASSLDMPTFSQSKKLIDQAVSNLAGVDVYGSLLLDPHAPRGKKSNYLSESLQEFENGLAPEMFPSYRRSVEQPIPYDSSFPYISGDSFFYGWGLQEANESYFVSGFDKRAIFVNADGGSLSKVRPSDGGFSPCVSAASAGYSFIIGSVGPPPADMIDPYVQQDPYGQYDEFGGAPHPTAMFISVSKKETCGEAWCLSSPILDTSFGCIGCPFGKFNVKNSVANFKLNSVEMLEETMFMVSQIAAKMDRSGKKIDSFLNNFLRPSTDIVDSIFKLKMKETVTSFSKYNGVVSTKGKLSFLMMGYNHFISQISYGQSDLNIEPSFIEFILNANQKLSASFISYTPGGPQLIKETINVEKPGTWTAEFPLKDMDGALGFIHFQARVYNEDGDLVDELKSYNTHSRWKYEIYSGKMKEIPQLGVFSGRVGAKIRMNSTSGSSLKMSERGRVMVRQILDRTKVGEWFETTTIATT
jgi:hypothetical protein